MDAMDTPLQNGKTSNTKSATSGKAGGLKWWMAQSRTALRAIRRLLGKCRRGSHGERHLPPHPSPLPRGEGESSTVFRHNPPPCLPDELPEQPEPAAGCSLSPWGLCTI